MKDFSNSINDFLFLQRIAISPQSVFFSVESWFFSLRILSVNKSASAVSSSSSSFDSAKSISTFPFMLSSLAQTTSECSTSLNKGVGLGKKLYVFVIKITGFFLFFRVKFERFIKEVNKNSAEIRKLNLNQRMIIRNFKVSQFVQKFFYQRTFLP